MPRSYSLFLIAMLAGGGWYFTAGPGKGKLGDVFTQVSQGQLGAQQQPFANPAYPPANYGNNNYGGYSNYAPQQPASVPASYASQAIPQAPAPPPPSPLFGGPAIHIATYNIQIFGDEKATKPYVMAELARVIRNFDIVAIQEIRTQDDYFIDNFLRTYVNVGGRVYDRVVGPRLGSSNSKEQYAFLYDTAKIEINRSQVYTINDPEGLLEREPLVAMFRVRVVPPEQAFTFYLIDVHTRPNREALEEVNTLAKVYQAVRRASGGEDDIILLGDLNVDDRHLGELGQIDGLRPIVRNAFTNTRQNAQYDNIIYHQPSTAEYSGRWGVYNVQQLHNLTQEQVLLMSDHLPVWAEFNAYESATPGRVANLPGAHPAQ